MKDLEISKQLARVVGWNKDKMRVNGYLEVNVSLVPAVANWKVFDYRDWAIISPIAERHNAFPVQFTGDPRWYSNVWMESQQELVEEWADTPQKAIALAVIGAKK